MPFYYSIACLLLGKDVEGIELFANALLISVSSLKAGFYAKNDEVLERIDDLAGWFGEAFKGSRLYQRRTVIRLFTEALKRQEQISS